MNVLLWVLQILLALYCGMGGFWMVRTAQQLGLASTNALPAAAWQSLGVLQIVCAVGLVLPSAVGVMPELSVLAAAGLAVLMLGTSAILKAKSLMSTGMLWAVVPALLAAFVAYGRIALQPF